MTNEPNTPSPSVAAIILAAGEGSRMKSSLPKPLHKVAGRSLLAHSLASAATVGAEKAVVVIGHGAEQVGKEAEQNHPDAVMALQAERLGTGHAVQAAQDALKDFQGDAFVLYADTPFIRAETLSAMLAERRKGAAVVALGFRAAEPGGYGRMIGTDGALDRIVEAKDATAEELAVTLCNSGVICADAQLLFDLLDNVTNDNANGEYYLTDIVGLARARNLACAVVECPESETMGVNSRLDLANAEAVFQDNARKQAMINGVTMTDPSTVWFSYDTTIGRDVTIEPNVFFAPGVKIAEGATIHANCHLEKCEVAENALIGPFARLRPGSSMGPGSKVGNFVELKNATLAEGAKVNHLAYVGDAEIGAKANIGAGVITCNYDGVAKHKTVVGKDAFIGTNSSLVAPVTVGDGAYVASGSVITRNVAPDALAIARPAQIEKPNFVQRFRAKLLAIKARKTTG
ncbi:MAG: bifunctional UDP-N-acetylglucosamine diphosphorylase/glucosamine-1-phosphate N-acetyltransferase GlmU [Pikeienuella sp.]